MRSCLEWGDGRICGLEGRKRMENGQYGQMDINAILAQVDALYEADKGEEAEQLCCALWRRRPGSGRTACGCSF